jgi:hypothetical protein
MQEYEIGAFIVGYGINSIGWESVERRPHNQAKAWINDKALDSWELKEFIVHSPQAVYVIMERRIDVNRGR